MFFNLLVCKFEYLQTIRVRSLRSFSLSEIVNNSLVRKGLLDIFVCKIHNQVAVSVGLPPNPISENDFLLA